MRRFALDGEPGQRPRGTVSFQRRVHRSSGGDEHPVGVGSGGEATFDAGTAAGCTGTEANRGFSVAQALPTTSAVSIAPAGVARIAGPTTRGARDYIRVPISFLRPGRPVLSVRTPDGVADEIELDVRAVATVRATWGAGDVRAALPTPLLVVPGGRVAVRTTVHDATGTRLHDERAHRATATTASVTVAPQVAPGLALRNRFALTAATAGRAVVKLGPSAGPEVLVDIDVPAVSAIKTATLVGPVAIGTALRQVCSRVGAETVYRVDVRDVSDAEIFGGARVFSSADPRVASVAPDLVGRPMGTSLRIACVARGSTTISGTIGSVQLQIRVDVP